MSAQSRPNIIHIVPHDLGADLGCYGHPSIKTPNLDAFAAQGVRFNNHFCSSTPCSPARGCAMTGRYAHSSGLIGLCNFGWGLPEDERTIIDHLNDAGYQTHHIGFAHEREKYDQYRYQVTLKTKQGVEGWYSEVVCDGIVDFLKQRKTSDQPFYLNAGFFEVHMPWDRKEYINPLYTLDNVWVPPFLPDNKLVREYLRMYHGSVTHMDQSVGRVLQALKETGLEDNTIVVFTTDHGISFPRAKSTMYDPGLRIALLMRWPGHIPAGMVSDELVPNIDLCPTLLDLAGVPVPKEIQGRSLKPHLTNGQYTPNPQIFSERNFHENFDPMRAVRTKHHKYIRNYADRCAYMLPEEGKDITELWQLSKSRNRRPMEELFDLEKDPNEFQNVAADPAYAAVLNDLRGRVDRWMEDTDDFMRGAYEFILYPPKNESHAQQAVK